MADRDSAAAALRLELPTTIEALTCLHEVAVGPGKDYVLVFTPENQPYDPLFED
ncbi:hypothetical protein ACWD26_20980 [Streptomyces sp. NPDC002787]